MTTLTIQETDLPRLDGQTAIVTGKRNHIPRSISGLELTGIGGSSGIGLATAKILASRGSRVIIFDIYEPEEVLHSAIQYHKCDISKWSELRYAFQNLGPVHIAVANAGVGEDGSYLADSYDEDGNLLEPSYKVIDVNFRGTLNFIKLALHNMKKNEVSGSIVITSSATAYAAEQSLPVYSGTKAAVSFALIFI